MIRATDLRIQTKVLLCFGLLLAVTLGTGGWAIGTLHQQDLQRHAVEDGPARAANIAVQMQNTLNVAYQKVKNTWLRGYDPEEWPTRIARYESAAAQMRQLRTSMEALTSALTSDERGQLAEFDTGWGAFEAAYEHGKIAFGGPGGGDYRAADAETAGIDDQVLVPLTALTDSLVDRRDRVSREMTADASRTVEFIGLLLGMGALVGLGFAVLLARAISRPAINVAAVARALASEDLPVFVSAARALAAGDLSRRLEVRLRRVPVAGRDELGCLAEDFNRVIDAIQETSGALEEMRVALQVRGEALEHQAHHDALTGLPNRVLFRERLETALADHGHASLGVLLLDLDGFKEVNDTLGHQAGDTLLQQVAVRLGGTLRSGDLVAREGGDEFAVLLPRTNAASGLAAADEIRACLRVPFKIEGQELTVDASIGVVVSSAEANDALNLLRCADVAMYVAKRAGGGAVVYLPEHDLDREERLALIREHRPATERRSQRPVHAPAREGRTNGSAWTRSRTRTR